MESANTFTHAVLRIKTAPAEPLPCRDRRCDLSMCVLPPPRYWVAVFFIWRAIVVELGLMEKDARGALHCPYDEIHIDMHMTARKVA